MKLYPTSGGKACDVEKFARSVRRVARHRTVSEAVWKSNRPACIHKVGASTSFWGKVTPGPCPGALPQVSGHESLRQ